MLQMEKNARPPFTPEAVRDIVEQRYGLRVRDIKPLPSELDRNFHIRSDAGDFVFKVAHSSVSGAVLDLQNATLQHMQACGLLFPRLVKSANGSDIIHIKGDNGEHLQARLLSYINGVPLCDFCPHSTGLLRDIGRRLGEFSAAMASFQHDENRTDYRWNLLNLPAVAAFARDMPREKRELLDHFLRLCEDHLPPALAELRHSFVYNDANDSNILVCASDPLTPQVAGFIDLGDMVYSATVADLAVALAYVMMEANQPLEKALPVITAYHEAFPLTEREISLLYPMIAARLCLSVCISWHQQRQEPDNRHLSVSEAGAWGLLEMLRGINPRFAEYLFRDACGLSPVPQAAAVVDWLEKQETAPIFGYALDSQNSAPVDLSLSSRVLARVADLKSPSAWQAPFREQLGDKVGIGFYDEVRPIYHSDMFAQDHHLRRAVHIGVDLFAPAGTPIYAPLPGTVHVLRELPEEQDYGPLLILRHEPTPDLRFYTLYGHLSPAALERWHVGQRVEAGALLAHIGDYPRNGNWLPHLHFQIVIDMLDADNFPGVCSADLRRVFKALCPDPNLILRLPFCVEAPRKPSRDHLMRRRQTALNPALSLSYRRPLRIERGFMGYLYDSDGNRYLDCVNNVPHVGHNHPRVVRAAQDQLAILNTNTRYLHETILDYAAALKATLPAPLSVCFFVNSGSEANELALRLARAYTGGRDFIVIDHAYHGHTSALIDISPYKFKGPGGNGKPAHVEVAAMPDGFRGTVRGFGAEAGAFYARSAAEKIEAISARGSKLAAFVSEGILGCGGQMPLPATYLERVYAMIRDAGGVCIADEVQTGFGRVGEGFWAFELSEVAPDIVTMGKPIANGHPFGAVVTTLGIAAAFNQGMEYFNTFGGNPVSCAVAMETLAVIQDDCLQANAARVGGCWKRQLQALGERFPIIGQVRGSGLFLGVELIRDRETLEAADWEADYIVERMKGRGILLSTEGPRHNVLKLKPPLCFCEEDVALFMTILEQVLGDTVLKMG